MGSGVRLPPRRGFRFLRAKPKRRLYAASTSGCAGAINFRLFCLLERDGVRLGAGGPSMVLDTGKDKPFRTVLSKADHADLRRLGDGCKARVPRSVLV